MGRKFEVKTMINLTPGPTMFEWNGFNQRWV
jgi:hypothetical protein